MAPTPNTDTPAEPELCPACNTELDGDVFHDVDDLERPYCGACCPTCIAELAELAELDRAGLDRLDDEHEAGDPEPDEPYPAWTERDPETGMVPE